MPFHLLRRTVLLTGIAIGWLAMPVQADDAAEALAGPVVVELFTSQGCSSCPRADRILQNLTQRTDVLPLALHVDYWDYLGWRDAFGDPRYSKRQKAYAHFAGRDMVYTPQMVVMGQDDVVGARSGELSQLIRQYHDTAPVATVTAAQSGNRVTVEVTPLDGLRSGADFDVQLVSFEPLRQVEIQRGENAGRVIDYVNIVTDWRLIGEWDGQGPMRFEAAGTGGLPGAVIVQVQGPGQIVAAARVD